MGRGDWWIVKGGVWGRGSELGGKGEVSGEMGRDRSKGVGGLVVLVGGCGHWAGLMGHRLCKVFRSIVFAQCWQI